MRLSNVTQAGAAAEAREWVYSLSLAVATAVIAWRLAEIPNLSPYEGAAFGVLFVLMFASNWYPVQFSFGSGATTLSVGSAAFLASSLWFGPWLSLLAAASIMGAVTFHFGSRKRVVVEIAASAGLAAALSSIFYMEIAGPNTVPLSDARSTLAALVAALLFSAINLITFSGGIAWEARRSPLAVARELSGGYHFFLSVPFLGIIIPIVGSVSLIGLLIIPIPLLLAHLALKALGQLQRDTKAALSSLIDALELRDPYTSFHSVRVTRYAEALLNSLTDLSEQERATIGNAARLHDIGKVAVRDAVLLKPGPLTDEEWKEMQSHSAAGASIVSELEFYRPLVNIIRSHHERWDGRGYPDNLAGEAIPIGGRVIGIADAFDAMTTDRPYRRALSYQQAIDELVKNKGKQFDAMLVDRFVASLSGPQFEAIRSSPDEARAAAD